jgi:hypothetical protein
MAVYFSRDPKSILESMPSLNPLVTKIPIRTIILLVFWNLLMFSALWIQGSHAGNEFVVGEGKLASGKIGVIIKTQNITLQDLLENIEGLSGIEFRIKDKVMNHPISFDIEASNWTQGALRVLEGYNRIELWGDDKQLTGVMVLGAMNPEMAFSSKAYGNQVAPETKNKSGGFNKEIQLSKNKLLELSKGPLRSPLPAYLFHDAELKPFLIYNKIYSQEDMAINNKAKRVRIMARRQLKELRKK